MNKSELEKLRELEGFIGSRLRFSDYEKMNILSEPRVSWLVKQAYQEWLGRMYAEGYINEAEHDARMACTEAARTERELRVAVSDLPEIYLDNKPAPPTGWYSPPPPVEKKKEKKLSRNVIVRIMLTTTTLAVVLTLGCVLGNWYPLPIACLALVVLLFP